jgi:sarcosine oxidase subunit gamma
VTVDPGLRRSPLAHRSADLAATSSASSGRLALAEVPFLAQVNLRVQPDWPAAVRIGSSLGLDLPEAGRTSAGGPWSALWLGPDEWLVVGPEGAEATLVETLTEALGEDRGSVVDVSAARATLSLTGPGARDLLEQACSLDLHPRAFPAGRCAQTTFARAQILLWHVPSPSPSPRSPAGPRKVSGSDTFPGSSADLGGAAAPEYRLMFGPSFADYFVDWLTDAAEEYVQ